jgi:hypothetical protein
MLTISKSKISFPDPLSRKTLPFVRQRPNKFNLN